TSVRSRAPETRVPGLYAALVPRSLPLLRRPGRRGTGSRRGAVRSALAAQFALRGGPRFSGSPAGPPAAVYAFLDGPRQTPRLPGGIGRRMDFHPVRDVDRGNAVPALGHRGMGGRRVRDGCGVELDAEAGDRLHPRRSIQWNLEAIAG